MSADSRLQALGRQALFVATLVASSTPSLAGLINGGFETGTFEGWVYHADAMVTDEEAHSGRYAFSGTAAANIQQSFAPIATSLIKELSFWGKRFGGVYNAVELTYSDNTVQAIYPFFVGQGNDWRYVDLTSYLATGKSLMSFSIFGTSPELNGGPAYIDDVKLQVANAIPEPATIGIIAAALLGVASTRSRKTTTTTC